MSKWVVKFYNNGVAQAVTLAYLTFLGIQHYTTTARRAYSIQLLPYYRQLPDVHPTSTDLLNSLVFLDFGGQWYEAAQVVTRYAMPRVKNVSFKGDSQISEFHIFRILDHLRQTASGLDGISAWFMRLAAPVLAAPIAPIADLFNMSLAASCSLAMEDGSYIRPIPKTPSSSGLSDFRPISVSPILCRILERIVVCQYIYPSLLCQTISYQFAFRPCGLTTAAFISILHTVTFMLANNKYVIVYAVNFSKAFDTVRHSTLFHKYPNIDLPDLSITGLSVSFESTLTVLCLRISCQIPSTSRPA